MATPSPSNTQISPAAASPELTVSALIGAAQARLSLGLSTGNPGMQTLEDALTAGPANNVPENILDALRTYMATPQCQASISDAILVAEFAVSQLASSATATQPTSTPTPVIAPAPIVDVHPGHVPLQTPAPAHATVNPTGTRQGVSTK
jgi:hypothetical protein